MVMALIWNNSANLGLYNFFIKHLTINGSPALSISLPFIIIAIFSVFFGYKLSYPHISSTINKNYSYGEQFIYLLKVKHMNYIFLSVAVTLSFFFFTKTFSYLIYHYPNFTIPFLRSFGTLRSYDPSCLIYSAVITLIFTLIAYMIPGIFLNAKYIRKNGKTQALKIYLN